MKKLLSILTVLTVLAFSTGAFAAWTLTPSLISKEGRYVRWKLLCTSDGDALTTTDLMALVGAVNPQLKTWVEGSAAISMDVSPGTGGVIPNTTIDITLRTNSDCATCLVFSKSGISNVAVTYGIDLAEDYPVFPPIYKYLYITFSDIGDSGDQVTLYFEFYTK